MWAHEVSKVGVMTGTHAGLYLPDVHSVLTPLLYPHISPLSLSSIGSNPPSVPLPHPLIPFIPITYWSLKK